MLDLFALSPSVPRGSWYNQKVQQSLSTSAYLVISRISSAMPVYATALNSAHQSYTGKYSLSSMLVVSCK